MRVDFAANAADGVSIGATAVLSTFQASFNMLTPTTPFAERVSRVAAIAAEHADAFDAEGRFPVEALAAMRYEGLLGAWIPRTLGGLGASLSDITGACELLSASCAAAGMIFATHQIQIATLVRHAENSCYLTSYLRSVARAQRLIAPAIGNAANDVVSNGDAVATREFNITLSKLAVAIPFGYDADDILATARRPESANANEQQLILLEHGKYALEQTSTRNAFGSRSDHVHGFALTASVPAEAVVSASYASIATETIVPVTHLLWSSLWLGMASKRSLPTLRSREH